MHSSRQPYPPKESYWANNVVSGVGVGSASLVKGLFRGIGGVVYDPYIGAKKNGFRGFSLGFFKGIGGLIGRPVKGTFDFVA